MVIIGMRKNENAATATNTPEKPTANPMKWNNVNAANGSNDITLANRNKEPRNRKRSANQPKTNGATMPAMGREQVTALKPNPEIPCATNHGEINGRKTPIDAYEAR